MNALTVSNKVNEVGSKVYGINYQFKSGYFTSITIKPGLYVSVVSIFIFMPVHDSADLHTCQLMVEQYTMFR